MDKTVLYFNKEAYHSTPLIMHYMMNAILQEALSNQYELNYKVHPVATKEKETIINFVTYLSIVFVVLYSSFAAAFFIMSPIESRVNNSKHNQINAGVSVITFNLVGYVFDVIVLFFICLPVMIIPIYYYLTSLLSIEVLSKFKLLKIYLNLNFIFFSDASFILLFIFVLTVLPMIYVHSYFYRDDFTGYILSMLMMSK